MKRVIKICGMRDSGNIMAVAALKPDILGFIFYPESSRFAGELLNPEILSSLPGSILKTGVFVNAGYMEITETVLKYSLDMVQLHGNETPELCYRLKEMGVRVIKVFSIKEKIFLEQYSDFIGCTDYFLFDTMTKNYGGSGQKFNWEMINGYESTHPFFLSGGIGPSDIKAISAISNPSFHGVDLNSRFETEPGIKDISKLEVFINEFRNKHNML